MSKKIKVMVLCGGRSPEHAISLLSAQNVIASIDQKEFKILPVGISKKGVWQYYPNGLDLENHQDPQKVRLKESGKEIILSQNYGDHKFYMPSDEGLTSESFDVIFPVLHGNFGEDGSVQGFSKLAGIPIVGCGLKGSVLSIDKDLMKKILTHESIAVAKSITVRSKKELNYEQVKESLGSRVYIKPACLGSSIGVSRATNKDEFNAGLQNALQFDEKVLIESEVIGQEIECAVLGNDEVQASTIGEIKANTNFYTFENKYVNADGAHLTIPVDLPNETIERARHLAIRTYQAMECKGLTRVDMFCLENGDLIVNELNTMPGFTNISMYPQLWKHSGIAQVELITTLIRLAIERNQKELKLRQIA